MKYSKKIFSTLYFVFITLQLFAQTSAIKKESAWTFMDSKKPLVLDVEGIENKILSFSFFTSRLDVEHGLISRRMDSLTNKTIGFRIINVPLAFIITKAYLDHEEIGDNQTNRVLFETKNKERFIEPNKSEVGEEVQTKWKEKNTYCYEVRVPVDNSDKVFEIMRQDIEKFFHVRMSIERKVTKCLLLVRTDSVDRLQSNEREDYNGHVKFLKGGGLELRRARMDVLVSLLKMSNGNGKYPIADGTNYNNLIDIDIRHSIKDIPALVESLKKYGLNLIVADHEIEMIVVRDAN